MSLFLVKIYNIIAGFLSWFIDFDDGNDIRILFWTLSITLFLVFFIEWLRKPNISLEILEENFKFVLYNSKNWKIKIKYKKSIWNRFFFRYSVSNLKIFAGIYNLNHQLVKRFQLKADSKPNPEIGEMWVPFALEGIVLNRNEDETYPYITFSDSKIYDGNFCLFDVWSVFLRQNIKRSILKEGQYYVLLVAKSNELLKKFIFKIKITDKDIRSEKVKFFEYLRLRHDIGNAKRKITIKI